MKECIICKTKIEDDCLIIESKIKEHLETFGRPVCAECCRKLYGKILTNELYKFLYPEAENND